MLFVPLLFVAACGVTEVDSPGTSDPAGPPAPNVIVQQPGPSAPSVTFSATPSTVASGASATLNWTSTNATTCTASGGWSGVKLTSGSETTATLVSATQFNLACTGPNGTGNASVTVSVTPPPGPSAPSVTLSATPSTVASGASATLNWTSTNATSCAASGGWSGAKGTSGSESSSALTSTTQFALACTGASGTGNASVIVSVLPPPGALPSWVNALAIGQWYEIPNTNLSSVGHSRMVVDAWNSWVADHRTSKVYSVASGGHFDYSGNEVYEFDVEREAPVWREVLAATPQNQRTLCSHYYADGRPTSRHSYYGVHLNEFEDRIMLIGGSWYCDTGTPFLPTMDSYNIGSNSYSPQGTHPNQPAAFQAPDIPYTLDPSTGDIYVLNGSLGRWNRSSNTWTANLGATGVDRPNGGGGAMSAFDTTRRRLYVQGGGNTDHHYYDPVTNAWTAITVTGARAGDVASLGQQAMVYVPALDAYLIRRQAAGNDIIRIDAATFVATTLSVTGGSTIVRAGSPNNDGGHIYNKFFYLPRLRGAVYVPNYTGNAWFLRLH